ncbi:MAG: hypothetical protein A2Y17_08360 [Clostridiales bacterium GWF2_38_85]|nr:MAG: hypothetical protein A2Y17_08360 [Clostridiales bacterium GWF2_38_85]HBL83795.1 hypothetical protein [Clostridiales bacterium]
MTDAWLTPGQKRRQEKQKIYMPLQTLNFDFIYPNSPVEFVDGYICYETESYRYYAVLKLQNVGQKKIKSVEIKFLCYQYANIPYEKISFVYSFDKKTLGKIIEKDKENEKKLFLHKEKPRPFIEHGDIFGDEVYIELPDSYFKRIELELITVSFEDGEKIKFESLQSYRGKKFSQMNDKKKYAYERVNIYRAIEEEFPIKNLPIAFENAWLCCCGQKNIISDTSCSRCHRSLDWQLSNINEDFFDNVIKQENDDPGSFPNYKNFLKASFKSGMNNYINEIELEKKRKMAEQAEANLKIQMELKEKKLHQLLPRIALYFAAVWILIMILTFIVNTR